MPQCHEDGDDPVAARIEDPSGAEDRGPGPRSTIAAGGLAVADALSAMSLLGHAFAVTGSAAAVLAQSGSYAPPSEPGQAFTAPDGRISVRLRPERLRADVIEREDGSERLIELRSADGRTEHRVRVLSDIDALVVEGLARTRGTWPSRMATPRVQRVFVPWEEGDQLAQIDAVLADGGTVRRTRLVSCLGARRIETGVLPALFEHLCTTQLPLSVLVFAGGLAQGAAGTVHIASTSENGRMSVVLGAANLDIELALVREALIVRTHGPLGPTSAIELCDDRRQVLAMLVQLGAIAPDVHRAWERLAASLPAAD